MSSEFFDHIPDEPIQIGSKAKAKQKFAFPCEHCGGKGKTQKLYGRMGYLPLTCPVCKGKGGFKTDRATREKNRAAAAAREARKAELAAKAFDEANPGVRDFLKASAKWSSFALSMLESLDKWGSLTDRQLTAVRSMMAKQAARDAERKANMVVIDAKPILSMFATAAENGLKRRALLAGGAEGEGVLKLTLAGSSSSNPGGLWVKADADFMGGISRDGTFRPRANVPHWVKEAIRRVAQDPAGEARLFGQRTGTCCCCGRELTNKQSIEMGIGPICASRWGL